MANWDRDYYLANISKPYATRTQCEDATPIKGLAVVRGDNANGWRYNVLVIAPVQPGQSPFIVTAEERNNLIRQERDNYNPLGIGIPIPEPKPDDNPLFDCVRVFKTGHEAKDYAASWRLKGREANAHETEAGLWYVRVEAVQQLPLKREVRTVDLTPTWRGILPLILTAIEHGSHEGRQIALDELNRMADAADAYNTSVHVEVVNNAVNTAVNDDAEPYASMSWVVVANGTGEYFGPYVTEAGAKLVADARPGCIVRPLVSPC